MEQQQNSSKHGRKLYKRPEFILLLLTGLLWIAFLFKVLFFPDTQLEPVSSIAPQENPASTTKTSPEEAIKLQSTQARSRNKLSTEQISAREEQEYIEALRESFDQVKPGKNNQIIRGEFISVTELPSQKIQKDEHKQIQILVDDKFEMDSLNAEYRRALRGRN